MGSEEDKEMFRSVLTYAETALKNALLISGGAAVALLAFMGNILAKDPQSRLVAQFSAPLACFVYGVLAAALASGGSYATQYAYFHYGQRQGVLWHRISVGLLCISYLLFAAGSFLCYKVFSETV